MRLFGARLLAVVLICVMAGANASEISPDATEFTALKQQFAVPVPPDARYLRCVEDIDQDVKSGRTQALRWVSDGGGRPAKHCAAIADLAAGLPKIAALRLSDLADKEALHSPLIAARLYAQAAEAWLIAGYKAYALNSARTAYSYGPEVPELVVTLAKVHHANEQWDVAIILLSDLEKQTALNVAALLVRAKSYLKQEDWDGAAHDVSAALKLEPLSIDALVMRGDLAQKGIILQ